MPIHLDEPCELEPIFGTNTSTHSISDTIYAKSQAFPISVVDLCQKYHRYKSQYNISYLKLKIVHAVMILMADVYALELYSITRPKQSRNITINNRL